MKSFIVSSIKTFLKQWGKCVPRIIRKELQKLDLGDDDEDKGEEEEDGDVVAAANSYSVAVQKVIVKSKLCKLDA